jgi:hypothetical protein
MTIPSAEKQAAHLCVCARKTEGGVEHARIGIVVRVVRVALQLSALGKKRKNPYIIYT